ncbi:type IV secretion system protein [Pseudomonas savastanoi]|uniref:Bacterial virulence protein VirB8 domain-containing protein n=1 Tax=Pseudomonas savastanoi pv. glycinea TaxID=318 RepID=A0A3M3G543_PSESG|nr:type IV secretion system protein [Pseudomonas savastanoi]RMM69105.1 hypothetical protein ALQ73_200140 [Pseudomonas savastanoi pv. glycinea]
MERMKKRPIPEQLSDADAAKETQRFLDDIRRYVESNDDIEQLLLNSRSWADSETEQLKKSRINAWRVTCFFALFASGCLYNANRAVETAMVPPPPPQVLVMDKATNTINPLMSLSEVKVKYEDALLRRALNTFMICRERYIVEMREDDYFCAAAFMSPQLQSQWSQYWDDQNPDGPLMRYGLNTTVKPEIVSIVPRENQKGVVDTAQVQFERTTIENGMKKRTYMIADIAFKMVNLPVEEKQRRVNDIGLQITQYTTNQMLTSTDPRSTKPSPSAQEQVPSGFSAPTAGPRQGRQP